ncbi:MAG TPA: hypothetical protein DHW82_05805 [Spirochaetia bacterium]|nr:hypothetical protein [Spirochaetia bacterium]
MRRILSFVVALSFVFGAVSLFAASADWNGYFRVKARTETTKVDTADKTYSTYAWQKLELYPVFTLSDNVALKAGFFHQQYWGVGRTWGFKSGSAISQDTGGYAGPIDMDDNGANNSTAESTDPLANNQVLKDTLGVSAAWATLTFMDKKIGVDVGRRINPMWGTGAFFGGNFAPDRIFVTYKTPGMGGMMIPFLVYEKRLDVDPSDTDDNVQQFLAGLIYIAPGKTLFGLTLSYLTSGKGIGRYGDATYNGAPGVTLVNGKLYIADLYIDHKVKINDGMSIKPIFEIVWATGKVADKTYTTYSGFPTGHAYNAFNGVPFGKNVNADILNLILKAEIEMKDLVKITPEVIFQKAPKAGTTTDAYMNFWGTNEFCGSEYTLGNIFNGYKGGFSNGDKAQANSTLVAKLAVDILAVEKAVKGLSAYVWFIYGMPLGKAKAATGTDVDKSDKATMMELSFGMAYSIDANTTVGFDAAWAKTGEFVDGGAITTFTSKTTYTYLGADLTIKF